MAKRERIFALRFMRGVFVYKQGHRKLSGLLSGLSLEFEWPLPKNGKPGKWVTRKEKTDLKCCDSGLHFCWSKKGLVDHGIGNVLCLVELEAPFHIHKTYAKGAAHRGRVIKVLGLVGLGNPRSTGNMGHLNIFINNFIKRFKDKMPSRAWVKRMRKLTNGDTTS